MVSGYPGEPIGRHHPWTADPESVIQTPLGHGLMRGYFDGILRQNSWSTSWQS